VLKKDSGLKKAEISLVQCNFVTTSLLTGFLKPVVVVPDKHFEADELEMIFHHELIHYKRKDLLVKLLSVIAISVHWFNPIIYWLCNAIQTESEASCDEAVILEIGENNRRYYAELIIEMVGSKKSTTMLSTCFYGGKNSMKRRLNSIMNTTRKIKRPAYATIIAIIMVTFMSGSVFAFSAHEANGNTPVEIADISNYNIEPAHAREIALTTVGGGTVVSAALNGDIYMVEVIYGDKRYEIDIDAINGSITNYHLIPIEGVIATNAENTEAAQNSIEYGRFAIEEIVLIAVDAVGGGTIEKIEYEYKNGQSVYELYVRYNGIKYEVKINGMTGEILKLKID